MTPSHVRYPSSLLHAGLRFPRKPLFTDYSIVSPCELALSLRKKKSQHVDHNLRLLIATDSGIPQVYDLKVIRSSDSGRFLMRHFRIHAQSIVAQQKLSRAICSNRCATVVSANYATPIYSSTNQWEQIYVCRRTEITPKHDRMPRYRCFALSESR